MTLYSWSSWSEIFSEIENDLNDHLIPFSHNGNGYFNTQYCTIEIEGSLFKPSYWVNDMKCRKEEVIQLVNQYKEEQEEYQ